ncbi:MAG: hypothetical protein ICV64_09855 [Thermoleophilia bacterium]|nr:hypothetical protein [Thermoleophilia bacterium]
MTWLRRSLAAIVGAVALTVVPGALAKEGDVLVRGTCTGPSSAKLKLSPENGRIEVEFEVDQNRVGQRWRVVLRQNGTVVRRLVRATRGPSGSFEARIVVRNRPGADRFVATATRPGERCRANGRF